MISIFLKYPVHLKYQIFLNILDIDIVLYPNHGEVVVLKNVEMHLM